MKWLAISGWLLFFLALFWGMSLYRGGDMAFAEYIVGQHLRTQ